VLPPFIAAQRPLIDSRRRLAEYEGDVLGSDREGG